MKRFIKSLLVVSLFVSMVVPAWGQASTQGKEFWVSSTIVCSPNSATATPYIAVSAEKACTVTVTGGVGNAINITQQVAAGSWNEFGNTSKAYNTNPTQGAINVQMDASKWYPVAMNNASNVRTLADQKNMYGLHITATENISVYVILSSTNSMDASNILPVTALGSEYYTQDYWPIVKSGFTNVVTVTTILATEDGTQVDIIPNGNTYNKQNSGQLFTITLNKGETYYLMSDVDKQLTGTHIQARNDKKIAIYCGVPLTNLPTNIAARDCLFEQPMPVNYWGTQFIVTRSLEKNGNLIGITASQRGTEIKVDGYSQAIINEGETFYIMLQSSNDPNGRDPGTKPVDLVVTADDVYIETSCPCAVYNYDTGNSYRGQNADEIVNSQGDPSSVWVSPIQQKIGKITFGTCYTDKTKDHFLNVVTETATCQNTKLIALYGVNQLDKSNLLVWTPVSGNPKYSYARAKIGDANTKNYSVFRLENPKGFIANIYGNGNDESYAYSAGSAAVEQGINIDGISFTDGYIYDQKFCFGNEMTFDANVGTDEISRVDWNFGDGTTEYNGDPVTQHTYTSPGWYDVTAALYGHQVCTDEDEMYLGSVSCSFLVYRPDTLVGEVKLSDCISLDDYKANPAYYDDLIANGKIDTVQDNCYDDVVLNMIKYRRETEETKDTLEGWDYVIGYNGRGYTESKDVVDESINEYGCPHYTRYYVHVIHCLDMTISENGQSICPGDSMILGYSKSKGEVKNEEGRFIVPGMVDEKVTISNGVDDVMQAGEILLPTQKVKTPGHYTGQLIVDDANCDSIVFDIHFTVNYPSDIFKFKFNNVLAVYQNRGYEFTNYQWYRNGEMVQDGPSSILYLGEGIPFNIGDVVFVVLTDKSGMVLPSCSQTIENLPDLDGTANKAPAKKVLIKDKFRIIRDEITYDIYGQRVQ